MERVKGVGDGKEGGPGGFKEDEEIKEIKSVDPIGDFKKMISDRKVDRVSSAIQQMQALIERLVKNSLKGDLFAKALECLGELRQACVQEDEAPQFNKFMEKIKKMFGRGLLAEFFKMVFQAEITLITNQESPISSMVTSAEAKKFLQDNLDD